VAGSARLRGDDLLQMSRRELREIRGSKVGFVGQNPFGSLNPILKIKRQFHNVVNAHRSTPRSETYELGLQMLRSVGIPGPERVLNGFAHELSGGMAQRVVIALAFVLDPPLLITDEPTTALDVTVQRQVLDLVRDLVREHDRSMLLVTHDLGVVAQYCDHVVVMYAGKIVESGPVSRVLARPLMPYTLDLLEAVPRRGTKLRNLRGRVPDLIEYPPGCPYATRCRLAFDRCAEQPPDLREVADDHRVACHLDVHEEVPKLVVARPS
jgi:oligopeptide/dipeptide ABC transporter ATP-binding protein